MKEIEKELDTIKRVITSILLELDEKDEQIKELYELVSKNDGKRE